MFFIIKILIFSLQMSLAQTFVPVESDDLKQSSKASPSSTESVIEGKSTTRVEGKVLAVRQRNGVSEVILENQRQPVVIPDGDAHNRIFTDCLEAKKKSKSLVFVVDSVSRQIISPGVWTSTGSSSGPESSEKSVENAQ